VITQRIDTVKKGGNVTQNGDIIVCPGVEDCPLKGNTPESERQKKFAKDTGIWCPPETRETLERLLSNHRFTAKELAQAWRVRSLSYDPDTGKLKTFTPKLELWFGIVMLTLFAFYIAIMASGMILVRPGVYANLQFFTTIAGFLGMAWAVVHFHLAPRRTAVRVRSILLAKHEDSPAQNS